MQGPAALAQFGQAQHQGRRIVGTAAVLQVVLKILSGQFVGTQFRQHQAAVAPLFPGLRQQDHQPLLHIEQPGPSPRLRWISFRLRSTRARMSLGAAA
jgi:hypothetical protein